MMQNVQKYLNFSLIIFYCFIAPKIIVAQVINPENHDQVIVIQKKQGETTSKVLRLLEKGANDSVLFFVDSNYINSGQPVKQLLYTASKEIQKYKNTTTVSEGLIVYDEIHNIYRCSYYDTSGEKFLIDIYYMQGDPNSKIVKFCIKMKTELDKERDENIKWNNNHKDKPPLPPRHLAERSLVT